MKCTVSESADRKLKEILNQEDDKKLRVRVFVAHAHGDHAHYGLGLDYPKETDDVIATQQGNEILLEQNQDFLDNVEIDYDPVKDEWSMTNPTMGSHHHSHDA